MDERPWAVSKDGTIEFRQLTGEYLDKAVKLIGDHFYTHENICNVIGVAKNSEAVKELEGLLVNAAQGGVSVIALEKATDKVVGVAFNKIQIKEPPGDSYFENYMKTCKQAESQAVMEFMTEMDSRCNLFDFCEVDCLLELTFLSTAPECRGKGIGRTLTEITIDIGRKLNDGVNVKKPIDDKELSLEPVPKIVTSIFTTFITQKIGRQLGFETAVEESFENFDFQGRNFAKFIEKETPTTIVMYKKL